MAIIDNDGGIKIYPQIAFVKGLSNDLSFYPNPVTNGVLNVVASNAKLKSVALFDINGKKVVCVNTPDHLKNITLSTQWLAKGIYLLEVIS